MSLAVDRAFESSDGSDRRGRSHEPRRSWASTQPVVLRSTPFNDSQVRSKSWSAVVRTYRARTVVLDAISAALAILPLVLAVYGVGIEAVLVPVGVAVSLVALLAILRGYEARWLGDGPEEFQAILRAGAIGAALAITFSYAVQVEISRVLVFAGTPLVILVASGARYLHRRFLHRARLVGAAMKRTLVVGERSDVERVSADLAASSYHGYEIVGACLPSLGGPRKIDRLPIVGALADVAQVAVDRAIDVVVVAGPGLSGEGLRRLTWALDRVGTQMVVVPDLIEIAGPRVNIRPAAGLSLLEVEVGAPRGRLFLKAILDRVAGIVLTVLAAPVIFGSALVVRLTSPGPAFYRQTRVGVDGTEFTMWKIRSMYVDSDARLTALSSENEGAGVLFKMKNDPRVTPVGAVLRRFSLDELPQLLNVLLGDMSLVGPRPPLGAEVAAYEDSMHRRLRVRPGLTGLWQVSGRSDLTWDESVRLDLRYVDNWSVVMDVMILWKTIRAVIRPVGAY